MKNEHESAARTAKAVPYRSEEEKLATEALQSERTGLDRVAILRMYLLKSFRRIERLSNDIDEAFAGQPLRLDLAPDAPQNVKRCMAYIRLHKANNGLFGHVLKLWMLSFGYEVGGSSDQDSRIKRAQT